MKTTPTLLALTVSSFFGSAAYAADMNQNVLKSMKPSVSVKQAQGNLENITIPKGQSKTGIVKRDRISDDGIAINRRTVTKQSRTSDADSTAEKSNSLNAGLKLRPEGLAKSSQADGFSIYSATSYLNADLDGDGYYSDFTLDFDADFEGGYADVYAVIYYSRNGGDWVELFETDVFTIFSNDASDEYSVNSVLNFGYPTGDYDILIDLYEDGVSGYVATLGPDEDSDLYALPLEDVEHESVTSNSQISYVATQLSGDFDQDSFYTDLTLEYDIDATFSGDTVYAEIVLTHRDQGWQQVVYSDDFTLGNQTEFVDLTFNTGYSAGWYDVQINLINAYTNELVADAGTEFSSLRSLPIESANNDDYYDNPLAVVPDVEVTVSGGGSFGWLLLPLLGLLVPARMRKAEKK